MAADLDVLRELDKRGALNDELSKELERLQAKNKGLKILINHDKELTVAELVKFFGGDVSRSTIRKYLKKHFTQIGNARGVKYINKILLFNSLQKEFQLTNHRKLEVFHY